MNACRIGPLIRLSAPRFPFQRMAPFSSSSATKPSFCFFSDDTEKGSTVFQHALKFQAPTTIKLFWVNSQLVNSQLVNSVRFIGLVDRPLQVYDTKNGSFGVYTFLRVKDPRDPNRTFRILLEMWNEMAERCATHLKPNDFIYVSGRLESYTNTDESGKFSFQYKATATELKYVSQPGQAFRKAEDSQSGSDVGEAGMEKYENRLYLWQVFFSNPYEWWDNRKCKSNPRQPDFRHKDTGEALWLSSKDPPWIKRQLELLDSKMEEQGLGEQVRSCSRVSKWMYDE